MNISLFSRLHFIWNRTEAAAFLFRVVAAVDAMPLQQMLDLVTEIVWFLRCLTTGVHISLVARI